MRRLTTAFVPGLSALLAMAVIALPNVACAGRDVPIIPVDWESELLGIDPTFLGFAPPPAAHDTVIYNGLVHIGVGDLQVDPERNILSLNPEATGLLGVSTQHGQVTSFLQEWLPFERDGGPIQPYLETVCITENLGVLPGEHLLGGSRARHGSGGPSINIEGGAIEYAADYSPIGATSYTVEIYLDGVLQTSASGLTGAPFVTTNVWPDRAGTILVADGNEPFGERGIPASTWQLIVETPILIVDYRYDAAGSILGDEIRIIPENVILEPEYLTRSIIRGRGIEVLHISDETIDDGNNNKRTSDASMNRITLVASPNPAPGGAARIAFSAPVNALSARLDIFDASGRSVRALPAAALAGRSGSLHWDGRDDAGRAVPAGNYFLRLTAGGESATERVTVLR